MREEVGYIYCFFDQRSYHVWTIRRPSNGQFEGQKGAQGKETWTRGLPPWEPYVILQQVII